MQPITQEKVYAGLRYAGVGVTTTIGVITALGALTPDQSAASIAALHQMVDGLHQAVGGFAKLYYILWPVAAIWLARIGINSTDVTKRIAAVVKAASAQTPAGDEAKKAIIEAAKTVAPEVVKAP